jgi:hypothetical protein
VNLRLLLVAVLPAGMLAAADRPRLRPVPKIDQHMQTGPAVGARIPDFSAEDQNGRRQTFDSLKGPHGLVLLFVRSADW